MRKYHIDNNGRIKPCHAYKNPCRYAQHFESVEDAHVFVEQRTEKENSTIPKIMKPSPVKEAQVQGNPAFTDGGECLFENTVYPSVYGFVSDSVNRFFATVKKVEGFWGIKVGQTKRKVFLRLAEWRKDGYPDLEEYCTIKQYYVNSKGETVIFPDHNFHRYMRSLGFVKLKDEYGTWENGKTLSQEYYAYPNGKKLSVEEMQSCLNDAYEDQMRVHEDGANAVNDLGYKFEYMGDEGFQKVVEHYEATKSFAPRPLQWEAINKITDKLRDKTSQFLLNAPTRSGKTFMAMKSIQQVFDNSGKEHNCAVVISGYADIKDEWQRSLEQHKDFNQKEYGNASENKCRKSPCECASEFVFLSKEDLVRDKNAVENAYASGAKNVVLFMTLQDLAGSTGDNVVKPEHEFLQKAGAVDVLVNDEAHFASFKERGRYREVLDETEYDIESDDLESSIDRLKAIEATHGKLYITATASKIVKGGHIEQENMFMLTDDALREDSQKFAEENSHLPEEDNPYYGLVEKTYYAVDTGFEPNELMRVVGKKGEKRFVHDESVTNLVRSFFGRGDSAKNFLNNAEFKESGLGENVLLVLETIDAVDLMAKKVAGEVNLNEWEIIKLTSKTDKSSQQPISHFVNKIRQSKKNTITLTAKRACTGITVEKWDTVIVMKNTDSGDESEQIFGRVGTPWIKTVRSVEDASKCRKCEENNIREEDKFLCTQCFEGAKDGVVLEKEYADKKTIAKHYANIITLDVGSFNKNYVEKKTFEYCHKNGVNYHNLNSEDYENIDKMMVDDRRLLIGQNNSVKKVNIDLINDYSRKSVLRNGLSALASVSYSNIDSLDADLLASMEKYDKFGGSEASSVLETVDGTCLQCDEPVRDKGKQLCLKHFIEQEKRDRDKAKIRKKLVAKNGGKKKDKTDSITDAEYDLLKKLNQEKELKARFLRNIKTRILFYAFLSGEELHSFHDLVEDVQKNNTIARDLGLDVELLEDLRRRRTFNIEFDKDIRLTTEVSREEHGSWEKFEKIYGDFARVSSNEIMTSRSVSDKLLDSLDIQKSDWERIRLGGRGAVDIGCKSAVNLVKFYEDGVKNGVSHDELKGKLTALPTSPTAYRLIRKVFEEYGWDTNNILYVDGVDNRTMMEAIRLKYELEGCRALDPEKCQYHNKGTSTGQRNMVQKAMNELFDKIDNDDARDRLKERIAGLNTQNFDYCLSNPPYQERTGTNTVKDIYHEFQILGSAISNKTSMIYPAKRWLQESGANSKTFGRAFLRNSGLLSVDVYEDSNEIFRGIDIQDGVAITVWDKNADNHGSIALNGVQRDVPEDGELLILNEKISSIADKTKNFSPKRISGLKRSRSLYGIESDHLKKNPGSLVPVGEKHNFKNPIKVLTILNGRSPEWAYMENDSAVVKSQDTINKWKVVVSSSHPVRDLETTKELLKPNEIHGRARASMAMFDTEEEAKNFMKYSETKLFKALFSSSPDGLSQFGRFVPDLEDYSNSNPHINWRLPLDSQLYKMFGLTEEEIDTIENS